MRRRAACRILAIGMLLGPFALAPVSADAASGTASVSNAPVVAAALVGDTDAPFDPGPLVLLLIAAGLGSMALLSRQVVPEAAEARIG